MGNEIPGPGAPDGGGGGGRSPSSAGKPNRYLGKSRKLLPEMEATLRPARRPHHGQYQGQRPDPRGWRGPARFLHDRQRGNFVELPTLLARGSLVVSFNLGPGAKVLIKLTAVARAYPGGSAQPARHIGRVPETARDARALQAARGVPFRVLTDIRSRLCTQSGADLLGRRQDHGHVRGSSASTSPISRETAAGSDSPGDAPWSGATAGSRAPRFVDPREHHRMRTEDIVEAGATRPKA